MTPPQWALERAAQLVRCDCEYRSIGRVDHAPDCRSLQAEHIAAALAAVRRSTLREVASLAMQWSPLEAGLPHNFDSWQHAIGLFVERLQRMANEESPDA